MRSDFIPLDHRIISEFVKPRSSVLDLGCGDGELLYFLIKGKAARGQGIEINEQAIYKCVAKGLNVLHGDIGAGLAEYPDRSFDYVIFNQSLQQVVQVDTVLMDSLRVGQRVIVGFPNFAHYRIRLQLFFKGKTPVTPSLPYPWYATPNLHFLSISDFFDYCRDKKVRIERSAFIGERRRVCLLPNLFAEVGLFLIAR